MAAPLAKPAAIPPRPSDETSLQDLLVGYRFTLCTTPNEMARALAVRRQVYCAEGGYDLAVPDAYDARAWSVSAEDVTTGEIIGTMRVIPRVAGALELEENFTLPEQFRDASVLELNRFAILPEYRRGKTFLPVVSLGMFKMIYELAFWIDARQFVVASKPSRVWSYLWLGFSDSGITAEYKQLGGALHHLLFMDFRQAAMLEGHQFRAFFQDFHHEEIVIPSPLPPLDLATDPSVLPLPPVNS